MFIDIPHVNSNLGYLGFVQNSDLNLCFKIERVYFLSNIPSGVVRGLHGHLKLQQILIPIMGSFDLKVITKSGEVNIHMNDPSKGFFIDKGAWRELSNFSADSCCLVLASLPYDSTDYYFDLNSFLDLIKV
jgi:dTDP-4-dehydrorhamnose 3,5-epimerase-like enzyme